MVMQKIHTTVFDFAVGAVIGASTVGGRMVKKLTGSATIAASAGEASIAMDNTNEAQNANLYLADNLAFDIDDLVQARFWARVSAAIGADSKWRLGLAGARNDDPDAITESIFFGADGNTTILAESDDGTTEIAAATTGIVVSSTLKKFVIDFSKGITTNQPPTLSRGGKYNVHMYVENASGLLVRVRDAVVFNLGAATGGLQPYVQLQKTATTNTGTLKVARIEIDSRVPG